MRWSAFVSLLWPLLLASPRRFAVAKDVNVGKRAGIEYCNWERDLGRIPPLDGDREERGKDLQLLQVQTLQRHGSRAPRYPDCWSGDDATYRCKSSYGSIHQASHRLMDGSTGSVRFRLVTSERQLNRGNCMSEQLLDDGYLQLHRNGEHFREAYRERLSFLPSVDQIHQHATLHASYTPRCLDSMEAFLSGIYPERNETYEDHVLEIETEDPQYDSLSSRAPGGRYESLLCPAAKLFAPEALLTDEEQVQALDLAHDLAANVRQRAWDPTRATLQEALDMIDTTVGCYELHMCTNQSDASYPRNLTQDLAKRMLDTQRMLVVAMESRSIPGLLGCNGRLLSHASMAIGPFVGWMLHHADAATDLHGPEEPKRWIAYTGHGTNFGQLAVLLGLANVDSLLRAPFGTSFTMELYEEPNEERHRHWVRFVFNGKVLLLPDVVCGNDTIAMGWNGTGLCAWSTVRRSLMLQVPTMADCSKGAEDMDPIPPRRVWWPGATGCTSSSFLFMQS